MTDDIADTRRKPDWVATLERAVAAIGSQPSNIPRPEGPPPAQPDTPKTTMPAQALRQDRMTVGLLARLTP